MLLVAKNTLSATPVAKYLTVSVPVYISPALLDFFAVVEHAEIKIPNITTKNVFFKI